MKKQIAQQVQQARQSAGISTYQIVKDGFHAHDPSTIEGGTKNYTIDKLIKYCKYVGATIEIKQKQ